MSAFLTPALLADWKICNSFARAVCAGRGISHNHVHMQQVTESALLIFNMELNNNNNNDQDKIQSQQQQLQEKLLRRIIHVGMLHDVADHKYEATPGELSAKVSQFVATQFATDGKEEQDNCMKAIEAISFSKEKKFGKRWFEKTLDPEWIFVRDVVSDADKLYAIGVEGLTRCWIYGIELTAKAGNPVERDVKWHTDRVVEHGDEKLLHLKDDYIVTKSGKVLAETRHQDMVDIFDMWKKGENLPKAMDAPMHW